MELNQEFLIEIFYSFCRRPVYKKYQNVFNGECPVCKEGKSSGRSRRLFYFPNKEYLYCHNCSKSWKPLEWVKEVTNLSVPEIIKRNRAKQEDSSVFIPKVSTENKPIVIPDLPENSIDITDPTQLNFYQTSSVVSKAVKYCEERRLFTAINSCKKFFISLEDKYHKNRLIIPFINNNKIVCYQTRSLYPNQTPKYLTKIGEKELFGFQNVSETIPYVFIFEGPIDSMFVKNGVAMASLSPTESQQKQLNSLIGYKQIYILDNDKNNKETSKKIEKYINEGKTIFIWPEELKAFKDFNEVCVKQNKDEFEWTLIIKNSFSGPQAKIKYKMSQL